MSLEPRAAHRPLVPKFAPGDDYTTFCEAVRRICGVDLLQYKRGQMERRVRTWTARRGTTDLVAYAKTLQSQPWFAFDSGHSQRPLSLTNSAVMCRAQSSVSSEL